MYIIYVFLVLLAKFGLSTSLIIRDLGILITRNENVVGIWCFLFAYKYDISSPARKCIYSTSIWGTYKYYRSLEIDLNTWVGYLKCFFFSQLNSQLTFPWDYIAQH